ncbi:MAG: biosynthetic arginine decarboxylase [Campylobacter sp.]|nr:biosynthetic arginine decarboxylase [Campylobacter sp.]
MSDYGLNIWGNSNFIIDSSGRVCLNTDYKPAIIDMVKEVQSKSAIRGPVLLRFPHLLKKQLVEIYVNFERAMKEYEYSANFNAVFPLKVNQYPGLVENLVKLGTPYNYGLEAGSKPELLLAMAYNNFGSPITVNGFKDHELINIGFIAAEMGHDITIVIEGLNELESIIKTAKERFGIKPKIGLRIRLHSTGSGVWAKSGGIYSKFGLNSTELIEAINLLKEADLIESFTMIHFHIGSQITEIHPLKKALIEAGNIYAELIKMGASKLRNINLGGGLAIEYSQTKEHASRNYTLREYANDVVYLLKSISNSKNVPTPSIFIEAGRYVAASHAVLVARVFELFTQEYTEKKLINKDENPPVIEELYDLYNSIKTSNALEYLHDAIAHMESVLTLFDLGYVDLTDRSNGEILVHLIIKKAVSMLGNKQNLGDLFKIQGEVQERYLVNFSLFQSIPDFWGLKQHFPIMPLERLDERPTRAASIWDITCDSDGEIEFDSEKNPLFLHDIDPEKEDYFLGFFLVGAYQEVLGMSHNLFTHPTEATILLKDDGGFEVSNIIESQSVIDILEDMDYDVYELRNTLNERIEKSTLIDEKHKKHILGELYLFLNDNSYLKSIG